MKFESNAFQWCSNCTLVAFQFSNELDLLATFIEFKKVIQYASSHSIMLLVLSETEVKILAVSFMIDLN